MMPSATGSSRLFTLQSLQRHAGVREREQRQDQEHYPRLQAIFQRLEHRARVVSERNGACEHHAGDGGVNAALRECTHQSTTPVSR